MLENGCFFFGGGIYDIFPYFCKEKERIRILLKLQRKSWQTLVFLLRNDTLLFVEGLKENCNEILVENTVLLYLLQFQFLCRKFANKCMPITIFSTFKVAIFLFQCLQPSYSLFVFVSTPIKGAYFFFWTLCTYTIRSCLPIISSFFYYKRILASKNPPKVVR